MSEQLKHKIQQWEAPPPPGCWEAIATRLNEPPTLVALPARLYDASIPPPATLWRNIASALDDTSIAPKRPVISLSRKFLFRTGIAAAFLIAIGVYAWQAKNRHWGKQLADQPAPAKPENQSPHTGAIAGVQDNYADAYDEDPEAATIYAYNGYRSPARKPGIAEGRNLQYASLTIQQPTYQAQGPITVQQSPVPDDENRMKRNMNPSLTNNNYLVITGPNGELTRASQKMAEALRYLYGATETDEPTDKSNNETNHWKKRLQEWRNKIISAHFIPTSANFLDIGDLKDLIDEKP